MDEKDRPDFAAISDDASQEPEPTDASQEPEPTDAPDLDLTPPTVLPAPTPQRPRRRPPVEPLPDATSLRAQVYALTGAQQVMFERLDQSLKLQDQSYAQLTGLMTQMNETLQLWQASFQQVEQLADKLARIAAATVKMYSLQIEQQNEGLF